MARQQRSVMTRPGRNGPRTQAGTGRPARPGPAPKANPKAAARRRSNITAEEARRRAAQSRDDKRAHAAQLRTNQRANRKQSRGTGAASYSLAVPSPSVWKLHHHAPTRVDRVFEVIRLTVAQSPNVQSQVPYEPESGTEVFLPRKFVGVYTPEYSRHTLFTMSTANNTNKLLDNIAIDSPEVHKVTPDPDIGAINTYSPPGFSSRQLLARPIDGTLVLTFQMGSNTRARLAIARLTNDLINSTPEGMRNLILSDMHHVERRTLHPGTSTFSFNPGLRDPTLYGRFTPLRGDASVPAEPGQNPELRGKIGDRGDPNETPFYGLVWIIEEYAQGTFDAPMMMTSTAITRVETELALHNNHLETHENRVNRNTAADHLSKTSSITKPAPPGASAASVEATQHHTKHGAVAGLRGSRGGTR